MGCSITQPTHKKQVTIMEPEVFEELNIDYTVERDLSKIVLRQPLLFPLQSNSLFQKRIRKETLKSY
jgi:hypothetical protein